MLKSVTEYNILKSITEYYIVLQSILQSITGYYKDKSSASTGTNFWACFCKNTGVIWVKIRALTVKFSFFLKMIKTEF